MVEPCKSKRKTSKSYLQGKCIVESPEKSKKKSMPKIDGVLRRKRKFLLAAKKVKVLFWTCFTL